MPIVLVDMGSMARERRQTLEGDWTVSPSESWPEPGMLVEFRKTEYRHNRR
jgi:hypothetical protein